MLLYFKASNRNTIQYSESLVILSGLIHIILHPRLSFCACLCVCVSVFEWCVSMCMHEWVYWFVSLCECGAGAVIGSEGGAFES